MTTGSLARVVPRLRAVGLLPSETAGDAELLERFIARHDQVAFEALVRRHGPMVFAVCRRVLRHIQDAEDAFQATFFVLAHKAACVSPRSNLAAWLHGVAHKTALKARHRAARRLQVETRVPPRDPEEMHPDTNWDEVEPLLDQEIAALPEHYRLPIVMCDLEDRPRTEVARTLGCSEGTLSSRLTRGRRMLAERLNRRGVHLSVGTLTALLAGRSGALAEPLIRATVPVALAVGNGGVVPPNVAELATGVMKSMFLKKLQAVALAALAIAAVALGLAGVAYRSEAAPVPANAPVPAGQKANDEIPADAETRLLMNRKVLKDMKCDMDQFDRIMDALEAADKKASQKSNEAMTIKFNAGGGAPNFEAINQSIREAQEAGEKEFRKTATTVATDVLTPAQQKRFREIDLQARGHDAFTSPAVVKALDLTAKQKEQLVANAKQVEDDIAAAQQRPGKLVAGAAAGGGGNVVINGFNTVDFEKTIREIRAEGMKRAVAILTDEQKTAWKKLVGEPFAHPLPLPTNAMKGMRFGGFGGAIQFAPGQVLPAAPPANVIPLVPAVPAVPAVPVKPEN